MFLRIDHHPQTRLAGKSLTMSIAQNQTGALWASFMPQRKAIEKVLNDLLYSIEIYPSDYFENFNPANSFEKWAAVAIEDDYEIPEGMKTTILPEGDYAVFLHKGAASSGPATYHYIYTQWLPQSEYLLDHRPHLAIMDHRYKGENSESEEEIWIPIKKR